MRIGPGPQLMRLSPITALRVQIEAAGPTGSASPPQLHFCVLYSEDTHHTALPCHTQKGPVCTVESWE